MLPQNKIEICQKTDYPKLIQLYDKLSKSVSSPSFFNWDQKKVQDELQHSQTLIIKDDLTAAIQSFLTFRNYQDRLEISAIGTDPAFLKKGLAQMLLKHLQANAAQRKLSVWLEVHENNQTAIKLYLKNGFAVLNTRKRYYPDGGNALVMQFLGA